MHPDRPLPDVDDPITAPFWEACRRRELVIQRDRKTGRWIFPPRPHYAGDYEWTRVSGLGRVFTFVIARAPFLPAFADELPLVLAVVELAEGPRLVGNLRGCAPDAVRSGMAVEVCFEPLDDRVTLPQWRPR
jgi:uncharacterized OB-fold protein